MIPESYFYLVDSNTGQPLALFSYDDCRMHFEVSAREAQIRVRYSTDDPESGVLLRNGYTSPLPIEAMKAVLADMRRKGVSPIWAAR